MTPNTTPAYSRRRPQNSNNLKWSLAIGVGLIALAFVGYMAFNVVNLMSAKTEGQVVFDQFMHAVAVGDYQAASSLTAKDFPRQQLDKIAADNIRYSKYQGFTANPQFRFSRSDDADSVVAFTGNINYGDWGKGSFGVNLRKVGDRWLIYNVSLDR